MAEINQIQFLVFVSLITLPVHGLDVILSNARSDFKQKYEIHSDITITNGGKMYVGTLNQFTYPAQFGTSKVIVHISSKSRFVEITRHAVRETRLQIAWELSQCHCEIVFLGVENFDDDEYHLISAFIGDKIEFHPNQTYFTIETIGVNRFDHFYSHVISNYVINFAKYQEDAQICGETLLARLSSIPHGVLKPLESNNKEIRLYEYVPFAREVTWPVRVENGIYVPNVSVSVPKYNFKKYHLYKTIQLIILSGKEYLTATNIEKRSFRRVAIIHILKEMLKKNEVLIFWGAFNFGWTEIDIVAQIIYKHSKVWGQSDYNVFTCGFGIFNTIYSNNYEPDGRYLLQIENSQIAEIMKKIEIAEEVKTRSIDMYYFDNEWKVLPMPINLSNGRYCPEERFQNFNFSLPDQKLAFIVYDSTEMSDQIDFLLVCQSVAELKWSGIDVILLEAKNFGWYDMHVIAEWVDFHRRNIDSEQVAVLGAGIFDTVFQSELTTYNTFLNKKNELLKIRNAYVNSANAKYVIAAGLDNNPNFEVWLYPISTLNGLYEPDLISDGNMFDTRGGKKIFFIITSTSIFQQISGMTFVGSVITSLRQRIKDYYPESIWRVYLVGLHNFGEGDSHLFAELVKAHTHDERPLNELVRTLNYGISQIMYQNKDTPFVTEENRNVHAIIQYYSGWNYASVSATHFH